MKFLASCEKYRSACVKLTHINMPALPTLKSIEGPCCINRIDSALLFRFFTANTARRFV